MGLLSCACMDPKLAGCQLFGHVYASYRAKRILLCAMLLVVQIPPAGVHPCMQLLVTALW